MQMSAASSPSPEYIAVSFGWRLPDNSRIKVTFNTRVISYEEDKDRWLVMLETLLQPADLSQLPTEISAKVAALSGKWAYVPDEARNGTTLPLKYETLTGRLRYFYAEDPRVSSK
jgi:hypothetical protein